MEPLENTRGFFFISTTWKSARFSLRVYINGAIVFALITLASRHLRERPLAFNYLNCYHTKRIFLFNSLWSILLLEFLNIIYVINNSVSGHMHTPYAYFCNSLCVGHTFWNWNYDEQNLQLFSSFSTSAILCMYIYIYTIERECIYVYLYIYIYIYI